jgi:hypothetical protein
MATQGAVQRRLPDDRGPWRPLGVWVSSLACGAMHAALVGAEARIGARAVCGAPPNTHCSGGRWVVAPRWPRRNHCAGEPRMPQGTRWRRRRAGRILVPNAVLTVRVMVLHSSAYTRPAVSRTMTQGDHTVQIAATAARAVHVDRSTRVPLVARRCRPRQGWPRSPRVAWCARTLPRRRSTSWQPTRHHGLVAEDGMGRTGSTPTY